MKKKLLPTLLLFSLSIFFHQNTYAQWQGLGTETDPYQLNYVKDLIALSNYVMADINCTSRHYFIMGKDIDFASGAIDSSMYFTPIGGFVSPTINNTNASYRLFCGHFDGNNHKIKNLILNKPNNKYVGLFGQINCAEIKNLSIINIKITAKAYSGGLIGDDYGSKISNCSVITNDTIKIIRGGYYGNQCIGGFMGQGQEDTIINSFASAKIINDSCSYIAGFVALHCGGLISNCFSITDISSNNNTEIGGFVGNSGSTINNCYAKGNIRIKEKTQDDYNGIGGFVGTLGVGSISNSYSTVKFRIDSTTVKCGTFGGCFLLGELTNCFYLKSKEEIGFAINDTCGQLFPVNDKIFIDSIMVIPNDSSGISLNYNQSLQPLPWKMDYVANINNGFPILYWQTDLMFNHIIVNDIEKSDISLLIYPNPTSSISKLELNNIDNETTLIIRDINGRVLSNRKLKSINNRIETNIDTSNFTKGIYLIELVNDKINLTKKLIVN